jgi:hypothetical protein
MNGNFDGAIQAKESAAIISFSQYRRQRHPPLDDGPPPSSPLAAKPPGSSPISYERAPFAARMPRIQRRS